MKKITQEQIRQILNCELATVSRYLTGKRDIKLISALKVRDSLDVPVEIFTDAEEQFKYFGKKFIVNENITNHEALSEIENNNKSIKEKV